MLCNTEATVVDLTGLDGCGFVFELDDGTRLMPIRFFSYCGIGCNPDDIDDPLLGFTLYEGQRVAIDYDPVEMASICMVGPTVNVTCIQEIGGEKSKQ